MIVEIDDYQQLEEVYGRGSLESALTFTQSVIEEHLTEADVTIHLDGSRFMSAFASQAPHEPDAMLNTCTRIQHALANVRFMTGLPVPLTASMGVATSNKLKRPTTEGLTQASFSTLAEASRNAPSAVRAFSEALSSRQAARKNRQRRETMIKKALQALTFWGKAGLTAPRIGVNFSISELRNTRLVDRIAIHLDVSNIAPHRLVIEVLETGIADGADDDTIGNLAALADLGCWIDLDDFGTGYASITNIRRFSVGRIKIDRSFVAGIDTDSEQRNMVAAIPTIADRLDVQTLAEGVETRGEKDALNALGCHDVQGFQIARPMPVEETIQWAKAYFHQSQEPVLFSKRAS